MTRSKVEFNNGSTYWLDDRTTENMKLVLDFLEYRLKKDKKRKGYTFKEIETMTGKSRNLRWSIMILCNLGYVKLRAGSFINKHERTKLCIRVYITKNLENKKFNPASHI